MRIRVLYGTESGNAELVADDLSLSLEKFHEVDVADLQDFDPAEFDSCVLYLIVCSTHGDGELPASAVPFAEALDVLTPDLRGVRYAMFGMGDRTYEHYSRGSELLDRRLVESGAQRIGDFGRHDASVRVDASDVAVTWSQSVLDDACDGAPVEA